ncbi:hypothetical protein L484_012245 [Morus notabilis]|uniref:Uncharacterized protein n=1 Tax=Morus notabilis TaxID=981085 RepID=W9QZU4_9ROSA|nr:hypothetical protein L484_012245 [Morus notabilis]
MPRILPATWQRNFSKYCEKPRNAVVSVTHKASLSSVFLVLENGRNLSQDWNDYPCPMGLHPSLNVVGYCSLPRHSCNRHL